MSFWARVTGRFRTRGVLSVDQEEETESPQRLAAAPVTPTGRRYEQPKPTATGQPFANPGTTAGTRSYGSQGGTPSTQRIHNPDHFK